MTAGPYAEINDLIGMQMMALSSDVRLSRVLTASLTYGGDL